MLLCEVERERGGDCVTLCTKMPDVRWFTTMFHMA